MSRLIKRDGRQQVHAGVSLNTNDVHDMEDESNRQGNAEIADLDTQERVNQGTRLTKKLTPSEVRPASGEAQWPR